MLLPLAGAVLLSVLPGKESKKHRFFALVFSLFTLVLCMRLWAGFVPADVLPFQHVLGLSLSWSGV